MRPLLAQTYSEKRWPHGGAVWVQPKFNGIRALYQNGRFQSRDEIPWAWKVLEHLATPLLNMFDNPVILDGELYVHGWKLQDINAAVAINRTTPSEHTCHVCYYVFDKVDFTKPFFTRFAEVEGIIRASQHPQILAATTVKAPNKEWVEEFYINCINDGYEGIMYRIGYCPYTTPKQPAT